MRRALLELIAAALFIAFAIVGYRALIDAATAAPVLHGFGIAGIALMLWAEVGHSLRRRRRRPGLPSRVSLSLHVVAGLVGPALVLVHTTLRFQGLAGAVALMTLLVVASGVLGRYIYPTVVGSDHGRARKVAAGWHLVHVPLATATLALAVVHVVAAFYFRAGLQ